MAEQMTNAATAALNRRLAERVGYTVRWVEHYSQQFAQLFNSDGNLVSGLCDTEEEAWSTVPNFARSHDAKAALLTWLAEQPSWLQFEFVSALRASIELSATTPYELQLASVTPLAVALAADAALAALNNTK